MGYNNEGSISTSFSTCAVSGDKHVGGLMGYNYFYGSITLGHSNGTVSGNDNVGGLVGANSSSITASYSTSVVTGTGEKVGGLVGINGGFISTSYSTSTISGYKSVGGLVGFHSGAHNITASFSTAAVSGNQCVGGLVGENWGHITSSYSTGTVRGGSAIGGLVGENRYGIIDCYSNGCISGHERVGGLTGYAPYEGKYTAASFWDIETSGQTNSGSGIGKTTDEMQTTDTFHRDGWDFVDETENGTEDIWWILEGRDYPRLWWETD